MTATRPFFSIVVPTRNRADLLVNALRSATTQTFDDYEVIVSNNASRDHTDEVIRQFAGPRVRHIAPPRSLSMPEHWEFALEHAQGEYVTFLCDDDALTRDALEKTAIAIRETGSPLLAIPYAAYYLPSWFEAGRRNALMLPRFTGKNIEKDSRASLEEVYTCRRDVWSPRMLNSFARRDIIAAASQKAGGVFHLSPDYSFSAAILCTVPKWVLIDQPLRLFGVAPEGIGAAMTYDRNSSAALEFVSEFGTSSLLSRVPVLVTLTVNHVAETLLLMKERLPDLAPYELDRVEYFREVRNDIERLTTNGMDTRRDWETFDAALAKEDPQVQRKVRRGPSDHTLSQLRSHISPADGWLRRRLFQMKLAQGVLLRGERWGFRDIVGAADCLTRRPSFGFR